MSITLTERRFSRSKHDRLLISSLFACNFIIGVRSYFIFYTPLRILAAPYDEHNEWEDWDSTAGEL